MYLKFSTPRLKLTKSSLSDVRIFGLHTSYKYLYFFLLPFRFHVSDIDVHRFCSGAKFRQQELWAWKPVWSPAVIVTMYIIVAVIFIPLGVAIIVGSTNAYSTSLMRYDDNPRCDVDFNISTTAQNFTCCVKFSITKNVTAPAYFYYGIVNFYQNARTYVSSRSAEQLRGVSNASTSSCEPLEYFPNNSTVKVPCGLTANSQFNDSFRLFRDSECSSEAVNLNGKGIAWPVDRDARFRGSEEYTEEQNQKIQSEDFMVWMRLAPYRSWKKLYRIIEDDLAPGNYSVSIHANYPVESFGGEKFFFLSETSWFGGPNMPLAISYLVVGAIALILAIFYLIRSRIASDLPLPPETTVFLDGIVKHPIKPQGNNSVTSTV